MLQLHGVGPGPGPAGSLNLMLHALLPMPFCARQVPGTADAGAAWRGAHAGGPHVGWLWWVGWGGWWMHHMIRLLSKDHHVRHRICCRQSLSISRLYQLLSEAVHFASLKRLPLGLHSLFTKLLVCLAPLQRTC